MINLIFSTNPVSLPTALCDICQGGMGRVERRGILKENTSFSLTDLEFPS